MLCRNSVKIANNSDFLPSWVKYIRVPCGKCDLCRITKSKDWAIRCCLETLTHKNKNCWFLTLTYDDNHVDSFLHLEHIQQFIKKLRKKYKKIRIKYFGCGEFGAITYRPHYHILIWNLPLDDLKFYKNTKDNPFGEVSSDIFDGSNLYMSKFLNEKWGYGFVVVGELNFKTAFYTARYSLKKNEWHTIQFQSQGIGKQYFLDHMQEIVANDCIWFQHRKYKIPRYFLHNLLKKIISVAEYEYVLKIKFNNQRKYLRQFSGLRAMDVVNYLCGIGELPKLQFKEWQRIYKMSKMIQRLGYNFRNNF